MIQVHAFWRMGLHGGSDVLIGSSILVYEWHGVRMQEWYKSIHLAYGWHVGSNVLIGPSFWRLGDMTFACKNGTSPSIDVLIGPSILAHGFSVVASVYLGNRRPLRLHVLRWIACYNMWGSSCDLKTTYTCQG
jgi:hypothetical protein